MRKAIAIAVLCTTVLAGGAANAASYVYVGSWNVADGPLWSGADAPGNLPPMSGVETAAYLFGGSAGDYAVSTKGTSVGSIDFSAWVDGYGDTSFLNNGFGAPVSQSFVGIVGTRYADGFGNYSAYVFDHACGIHYCAPGGGEVSTNYAFRVADVPEPASWAMMLGGFAVVGSVMRRRRVATSVTYG